MSLFKKITEEAAADEERGMTLIEASVWVGVLAAAMIALGSSLVYFYRVNRFALQDASAIQSAQRAMDVAVRAIRTASYSNIGAYPVISISPSEMVFYSSIYKNNPNAERVRFFSEGNSFKQGVVEPSGDPPVYTGTEIVSSLSDYVLNGALGTSTFRYYDQSGAPITDYARFDDVRFVTVNLVVDVSTTSLPTSLTITSSSALRNLITH